MPWPKELKIRVNMPYKKGYVRDIDGEPVGMEDANGKALAKGFYAKVLKVRNVQPDLSRAQYAEAELLIVKSNAENQRESYKASVPVSDLCKNTKAVLCRVVGEDAVFLEDDPFDKLLQVIVAASIHPETAPTYTTESWVEGDSWYTRGKRVGPAVEINREMKDPETNEVLYRLRTPRLTGEGWEYCTVTWNELLSGTYRFNDGRNMSVADPTQAFMAITDRWNSLPEGQRNAQMLEEKHQPEKDLQARKDAMFNLRRP